MNLNAWSTQAKLRIFESLKAGKPPEEGEYDPTVLSDAFAKGNAQIGVTVFEPERVKFEYIFQDASSDTTILTVTLPSPERIVFLPVPSWVLESIWQGEISGSFHFESEAKELLEKYEQELTPEKNKKWFEPQPAKRRE